MKKIIAIVICLLCLSMVMTGCKNRRERYVEGDFIYEIWEQKDGEKVSKIVQLSDVGKLKEILVLPETLGGYKVASFSYEYGLGIRENIDGKNLKRIYCPYEIYFPKLILQNCEKLEKVFIFKGRADPYCACHSPYTSISADDFANVVYNYNYLGEMEDCYWIDDYDYGTKIMFIPPNPTRDGYFFDGWYKEKDCINKWDFDADKLPKAITKDEYLMSNRNDDSALFENGVLFQLTKLYAKWIKI